MPDTLEEIIADLSSREGPKRCMNCGDIFKPRNDQQKHCSDNCRKTFHKKGKVGHKVDAMIRSAVKDEVAKVVPELTKIIERAVGIIKRQEG